MSVYVDDLTLSGEANRHDAFEDQSLVECWEETIAWSGLRIRKPLRALALESSDCSRQRIDICTAELCIKKTAFSGRVWNSS